MRYLDSRMIRHKLEGYGCKVMNEGRFGEFAGVKATTEEVKQICVGVGGKVYVMDARVFYDSRTGDMNPEGDISVYLRGVMEEKDYDQGELETRDPDNDEAETAEIIRMCISYSIREKYLGKR
ncbi:MAG: hypothetical protein HYW25_05140 [Candidatus Aenigmarchaeota archaeon]|nr:hypothetical protein [Candidatus Aenigmarchaeota archaeon]